MAPRLRAPAPLPQNLSWVPPPTWDPCNSLELHGHCIHRHGPTLKGICTHLIKIKSQSFWGKSLILFFFLSKRKYKALTHIFEGLCTSELGAFLCLLVNRERVSSPPGDHAGLCIGA